MAQTVEGSAEQPVKEPAASEPARDAPEAFVAQASTVTRTEAPSRQPVKGPVGRGTQARRTRVAVRRVGPLSVLKFSLIFYFCVMLIFYLGLLFLFGIMSGLGIMDKLGEVIGKLGFAGPGQATFRINGRWVFTRLFVVGSGMVVIWSLINLFVAFLYNLISDVVGGVEITLAEKR